MPIDREQDRTKWAWLVSGSAAFIAASWVFGYEDNYTWLSRVLPVPEHVELSESGWVAIVLGTAALGLGAWAFRVARLPARRVTATIAILASLAMIATGVVWAFLVTVNY